MDSTIDNLNLADLTKFLKACQEQAAKSRTPQGTLLRPGEVDMLLLALAERNELRAACQMFLDYHHTSGDMVHVAKAVAVAMESGNEGRP